VNAGIEAIAGSISRKTYASQVDGMAAKTNKNTIVNLIFLLCSTWNIRPISERKQKNTKYH